MDWVLWNGDLSNDLARKEGINEQKNASVGEIFGNAPGQKGYGGPC